VCDHEAVTRRWRPLIAALAVFACPAIAANDWTGAAQELASQVAALTGQDLVTLAVRNRSSLPPALADQVRHSLEQELSAQGLRLSESGAKAGVTITISENATRFLLVGEIERAGAREVRITSWEQRTNPAAPLQPPRISIERTLLLEQEAPILDLELMEAAGEKALLVLEPRRIVLYSAGASGQQQRGAATLDTPRPLSRDLRGMLTVSDDSFQAYLPGVRCRGAIRPALSADCQQTDEPWPVEAAGQMLGLADTAQGRNFFTGRVTTIPGGSRMLDPFFSAAAVEEEGHRIWILAGLDGRARVYDNSWKSLGTLPGWGSDIAALAAPCERGSQLLATSPSQDSEADLLQAYSHLSGEPAAASPPVRFSGPITALWPAGEAAAIAVSHDPTTRKYAAFRLLLRCGP